MGKPSDLKRRARRQRPGKRERARVKKHRRSMTFGQVPDAGTFELKAGRKKQNEFYRSRRNPFSPNHHLELGYTETADYSIRHVGEPISKVGTVKPNGQAIRRDGVIPSRAP